MPKRKHPKKYTLHNLRFDSSFALAKTIKPELLWIDPNLKNWKYAAEKDNFKQELTPISFKYFTAELTLGEQVPQGVALLFPNGLRAHFGSGSEKLLMELLTHSLEDDHV